MKTSFSLTHFICLLQVSLQIRNVKVPMKPGFSTDYCFDLACCWCLLNQLLVIWGFFFLHCCCSHLIDKCNWTMFIWLLPSRHNKLHWPFLRQHELGLAEFVPFSVVSPPVFHLRFFFCRAEIVLQKVKVVHTHCYSWWSGCMPHCLASRMDFMHFNASRNLITYTSSLCLLPWNLKYCRPCHLPQHQIGLAGKWRIWIMQSTSHLLLTA